MKAFITKRCLTTGIIQEAEGEEMVGRNGKVFKGKIISNKHDRTWYFNPGEYFFSLEEAVANAQQRVLQKKQSHLASITRLDKMQFITANIEG